MLYRLDPDTADPVLEPVPFHDLRRLGGTRDLEDLVAEGLLDRLFEEAALLPISHLCGPQAEADLYALDREGDLVISELKRETASVDAVEQILRYARQAGQWSHNELEWCYRAYACTNQTLREAHKEAFDLEQPLEPSRFNRRQRLMIIGFAGDEALSAAIRYWQGQGIRLDFIPYRIYEVGGERYFELFAPPHDFYRNPAERKGVLFDTNRNRGEESIWEMIEGGRVAAQGTAKHFVDRLAPGDIVFLSHRWRGLVAAARVRAGEKTRAPSDHERYKEVDFLTPIPRRGEGFPAMPFEKVSTLLGKDFYWASTIKVPYLCYAEAETLLEELEKYLR